MTDDDLIINYDKLFDKTDYENSARVKLLSMNCSLGWQAIKSIRIESKGVLNRLSLFVVFMQSLELLQGWCS